MPAVLDRPHPLPVQSGGEPQRLKRSGVASQDLALPAEGAALPVDRDQHVVALVGACPDHDHVRRPFVELDEADLRRTPRIALDDALRICFVLRDGDSERYERAAVRWLGRFALEATQVTIEALRPAADALDALPDQPTEAMEQLQRLCVAHRAT